jgi:hypothetical protein
VIATLATLVLIQAGPPTLSVTVDRTRLDVGQDVVMTVRATSGGSGPLRIVLPDLDAFEVLSRSERSELSFGDSTARVSTVELVLRALEPGTHQLGPFTAEQSGATVRAASVTIVVTPGRPAARTVTSRVRQLLARAPPPRRPGEPALTLVSSASSAYVGQQIDIVTAAWFPRDLRARLRRPPTLTPPTLSGVWSYPQATPPGIAASRQVGGTWYDLFISHQVVFPLVPGTLEIAPASLQYSVPVALQFFSQEERYNLESNRVRITVNPLPEAGKPANFAGAVGRDMRMTRTAATAARAGEAVPVEVTLTGKGNVALWPEPGLRWPRSLRHYQDRTDDRITNEAGELGGTKLFRYLALPDSAGPLRLPAVEYSYFDLDTERYRTLGSDPVAVAVAPADESVSSRPEPPPLLAPDAGSPVASAARLLPLTVWLGLGLVLPLAAGSLALRDGWRRRRRRRSRDVAPGLPASDRRLLSALGARVPDAEVRTGPALVAALRAAGVDTALAQRITDVRDAYLSSRYGPEGAGGRRSAALARQMDELTVQLGGQSRHRERRGTRAIALVPLLLAGALAAAPPQAAAQAASAQQLYQEGAYRAAADAFRRAAEQQPERPAAYYGLGAAEYRLGSDARAFAAWLEAARISPRSRHVRRALALVPPVDGFTRSRTWVAPVTPAELGLLALLAWCGGWAFFLWRGRRFTTRSGLMLAAGLALGAGAAGLAYFQARPLAILVAPEPLRLSPHGRAPEVASLTPGAAVVPGRRSGDWWLVQGSGGRIGWLPAGALALIGD